LSQKSAYGCGKLARRLVFLQTLRCRPISSDAAAHHHDLAALIAPRIAGLIAALIATVIAPAIVTVITAIA
jgi:hypothetical protein